MLVVKLFDCDCGLHVVRNICGFVQNLKTGTSTHTCICLLKRSHKSQVIQKAYFGDFFKALLPATRQRFVSSLQTMAVCDLLSFKQTTLFQEQASSKIDYDEITTEPFISARNKLNPMTSFVLSSLTSGGMTRDNVKSFVIDQTLKDG